MPFIDPATMIVFLGISTTNLDNRPKINLLEKQKDNIVLVEKEHRSTNVLKQVKE